MDEYVHPDDASIYTNTVEDYFSIFKRSMRGMRGMRGVYQHCAKKHLHRYMAEFDFRYSNRVALGVDDQERATRALKGVVGKRLKYQGGCDEDDDEAKFNEALKRIANTPPQHRDKPKDDEKKDA